MSEIFDKKFVHFMWDDELKGKACFVADNIADLIFAVRNDGKCGVKTNALQLSSRASLPFLDSVLNNCYPLAYYDPNYEIKKAFNEGKKVQYLLVGGVDWADVENEAGLAFAIETERTLRIKPEEEKWIAYLNRTIKLDSRGCYLTACREDRWKSVQKDYGAKIKLFVGAENEVMEWYKARQKFALVIKAWEDRKEIQLKASTGLWYPASNPDWNPAIEYRIKPQIGQIELITTANPLQKKDGWYFCDGRKMPKEFIGNKAVEEVVNTYGTPGSMMLPDKRPERYAIYLGTPDSSLIREDNIDSKACVGCDKSSKKYRPYINSAEMIADFTDRFLPVKECPSYCLPLIWVKGKETAAYYLIDTFRERSVRINSERLAYDFASMFEGFVYLDGSPVGMEVEG